MVDLSGSQSVTLPGRVKQMFWEPLRLQEWGTTIAWTGSPATNTETILVMTTRRPAPLMICFLARLAVGGLVKSQSFIYGEAHGLQCEAPVG